MLHKYHSSFLQFSQKIKYNTHNECVRCKLQAISKKLREKCIYLYWCTKKEESLFFIKSILTKNEPKKKNITTIFFY